MDGILAVLNERSVDFGSVGHSTSGGGVSAADVAASLRGLSDLELDLALWLGGNMSVYAGMEIKFMCWLMSSDYVSDVADYSVLEIQQTFKILALEMISGGKSDRQREKFLQISRNSWARKHKSIYLAVAKPLQHMEIRVKSHARKACY